MRLIKLLILLVMALVLVVVALANREPMTLKVLPEELARFAGLDWQITLPTFLVLLGAVLLGLALGFVWEWLREHKHRVTAVQERRERVRLEHEVRKVAPEKNPGDDVLAILDGR